MEKNEALALIAEFTAEVVREEAVNLLKEISESELKAAVEAKIAEQIAPLKLEIESTSSFWVKIRNRVYIQAINSASSIVLAQVKKGIAELK